MFSQNFYCSAILAKKIETIDPLQENIKNLFHQVMMTSDMEVKKKFLDEANVLDFLINGLEDMSQVTKCFLHDLRPKVQKHFITLRSCPL